MMALERIEFSFVDLWVQLHCVPLGMFCFNMAALIGKAFGQFTNLATSSLLLQGSVASDNSLELVYGTDNEDSVASSEDLTIELDGGAVNLAHSMASTSSPESSGSEFFSAGSSNSLISISGDDVSPPLSHVGDAVLGGQLGDDADVATAQDAHVLGPTMVNPAKPMPPPADPLSDDSSVPLLDFGEPHAGLVPEAPLSDPPLIRLPLNLFWKLLGDFLARNVPPTPPQPPHLGLSIECCQGGVPATLQLCIGRSCLIFQLRHSEIPESLKNFLRNPNFHFVCIGMRSDIDKLGRNFGLAVTNAVDVRGAAAEEYESRVLRDAGLKDLTRRVLGKEFQKPPSVTSSGWDNR
ncbi:hypothetical protein RJ640_022293 [Escallonia rubra]|uniref:3'-5' exonuclease domain-containing protein n=1 Tax=Escallonia rubra TaxID=112253 RepID=A0AA88U3Y8_9ASTE|nr:hypothetical protein RJ640_022293 [Escallonia rubra]